MTVASRASSSVIVSAGAFRLAPGRDVALRGVTLPVSKETFDGTSQLLGELALVALGAQPQVTQPGAKRFPGHPIAGQPLLHDADWSVSSSSR